MSEAKDLLAGIKRRKMILRFAQDDKSVRSLRDEEVHQKFPYLVLIS